MNLWNNACVCNQIGKQQEQERVLACHAQAGAESCSLAAVKYSLTAREHVVGFSPGVL